MSYILDALQRADQERNLGEVPKLDMALHPGAAQHHRGWLPTLLLIVFLASLIATGLWLLQSGYLRFGSPAQETGTPAADPAPAPAASEPARPAVKANQARPVEPAAARDPQTAPQSAAIEEPLAQAPAATPQAETPKPVPSATQPEPAAKAPEPESRSARLPTPTVAPAPPPSWVRKEEAERFRQENAPDEPVQSYLGLPQSFRNNMGKLDMNAHVFSTNPARSFVLINSKRYRIGDHLAEGPELVDILPDGAVLEHRGETFLLPVQR